MKLYVWNSPHDINYGGCAIFAVAESEEQARNLIAACPRYAYFFNSPERDRVGYPVEELKNPSRVIDLPCAEFHWFSE